MTASQKTPATPETLRVYVRALPLSALFDVLEQTETAAKTDEAVRVAFAITAAEVCARLDIETREAATSSLGIAEHLRIVASLRGLA